MLKRIEFFLSSSLLSLFRGEIIITSSFNFKIVKNHPEIDAITARGQVYPITCFQGQYIG